MSPEVKHRGGWGIDKVQSSLSVVCVAGSLGKDWEGVNAVSLSQMERGALKIFSVACLILGIGKLRPRELSDLIKLTEVIRDRLRLWTLQRSH